MYCTYYYIMYITQCTYTYTDEYKLCPQLMSEYLVLVYINVFNTLDCDARASAVCVCIAGITMSTPLDSAHAVGAHTYTDGNALTMTAVMRRRPAVTAV